MSNKKCFHAIRIETEDSGLVTHIYIDGEEVSGVNSAIVKYEPRAMPIVQIGFNCNDLHIDADKCVLKGQISIDDM